MCLEKIYFLYVRLSPGIHSMYYSQKHIQIRRQTSFFFGCCCQFFTFDGKIPHWNFFFLSWNLIGQCSCPSLVNFIPRSCFKNNSDRKVECEKSRLKCRRERRMSEFELNVLSRDWLLHLMCFQWASFLASLLMCPTFPCWSQVTAYIFNYRSFQKKSALSSLHLHFR